MRNITVYLHNGELKHEWDGHSYNEHVLQYDRSQSFNPASEMVELDVYCVMCEERHSKRIHTEDEWRVDILYTYLCGQFEDSCPTPRDKIAKVAKQAWKKHKGSVFTNDVRMDIEEKILDVCDDNTIQVRFE